MQSAAGVEHEFLVPGGRWFQHESSRHAVQFYSDDNFLIEELSGYVRHALHSGNSALVVATPEHRKALTQSIIGHGLDLSTYTDRGQFIAMDAADTLAEFMIENWPDRDRFVNIITPMIDRASAANDRPTDPRVAIYGEMVALLWEQGKTEAAIRLERLWNELAQNKAFSLFCGYPIGCFAHERDAELLMRVCGEHSAVIPTESYTNLAREEDRRREIVHLQHKAKALETEVAEHKRLRQELETRVEARTAELQSKNAQLLDEIKRREDAEISLRTLTSQLLLIRDEERRRVAHELHESTAQVLATLAINLGLLEEPELAMGPRDRKLVRQSSHFVEQLLNEVRQLSDLLHPPTLDEAGLSSALRWYAERFTQRTNIKVNIEVPEDLGRFSPDREIAAFRVVQESLNNFHRHGACERASVRVQASSTHLKVEVREEGIADQRPTSPQPSIGITGMRERLRELGGRLTIHSNGTGAEVTAELPR